MYTDILIIGSGLSGLHIAHELQKLEKDFLLVEARDRLGGRIMSCNPDSSENHKYNECLAAVDLGPSWFWPGQSRIRALIAELGLHDQVFEQASDGNAVYQDQQGNLRRGVEGISMSGSYRLKGGIQQIIAALAQHIPLERITQSTRVTRIKNEGENLISTFIEGKNTEIRSRRVVLALPPRLAVNTLNFSPPLTDSRISEFNSTATWMAGQAKFVAIYESPFWKESRLSGDVFSHRGPLHEIHDASAEQGPPYALFGFVSVPPQFRHNRREAIERLALDQLSQIFGEEAKEPNHVYFKDWAFDTLTATAKDLTEKAAHSLESISAVTEDSWDHRLIWSGSETAGHEMRNNGYLEGALEASERTLSYLISQ